MKRPARALIAAAALAATAPAAPARAAEPPPPTPAQCAAVHAHRTLAPISSLDARRRDTPRVFAIQLKQDVANVATYGAFRTKVECVLREWVVPRLAPGRPNVVVFGEDTGLATIATGSRGRAARALFADPSGSPSCGGGLGAPCGALGALSAIGAAYGPQMAAYTARFGPMPSLSGIFVAATDTFARGFTQTFSDLAKRYGVYLLASSDQARFRESTDPADIALLADPDVSPRPSSVYVATGPQVYNEAFLWGPRDVRTDGPPMLRNVVASNRKVPLTDLENLLGLTAGPSSGPEAVANLRPYPLPGTKAKLGIATSLPAFDYGPPAADPCADVAAHYMRCLDSLGADVVLQDEANPGEWATYTSKDAPDRGAWQPLSWMASTYRAVTDPSVHFDYDVTAHLVGNLVDLPFDGQTAITQRGLAGRRTCRYVGNAGLQPGADPAQAMIGGEAVPLAPFTGPKTAFVALAPWVRPDGPRAELTATADQLASTRGPLADDYLETALVADLPVPPRARTPCATSPATSTAVRVPRKRRHRPRHRRPHTAKAAAPRTRVHRR